MKLLKKLFKFILYLLGILFLFILIIATHDAISTRHLNIKDSSNTFLIKNVNIIPMTQDTVLSNKMVYIKDGIIASIDDNILVDDVEIIDANNQYLTPGLIDMHVHVWDTYEFGLYLSNGVTAVRNLWGMPMHLRMKEAIKSDNIYAPMFYTTGPKLTGPEFIGDDNMNLYSPEEVEEKISSYKERGYDFIKSYYGLTEDIFDEVIKQTEAYNMDIAAHPSQKVSYDYHFHSQIKSIEHAEEIIQQPLNYQLDTLKLKEVISSFPEDFKGNFCPTLVVYNNIYQMLLDDDILEVERLGFMNPMIKATDSEAQFDRWYNTKQQDSTITQRIKDQHDFHLDIVKRLNEANIPIICGTDAGIGVTVPGYSIHRELAFYKEAGLTNYEVLKTATINAANTHQIMNDLGSVKTGKVANLLLLENNPLEDLSALKNPSQVFIKGKKLDRNQLNTFENKAKNRNNLLISGLRYAENLLLE